MKMPPTDHQLEKTLGPNSKWERFPPMSKKTSIRKKRRQTRGSKEVLSRSQDMVLMRGSLQ